MSYPQYYAGYQQEAWKNLLRLLKKWAMVAFTNINSHRLSTTVIFVDKCQKRRLIHNPTKSVGQNKAAPKS